MKKSEIKQGEIYQARVSGNLVLVRVEEIIEHESRSYTGTFSGNTYKRKAVTRYDCTNLSTGRTIIVKSAARLRPRPINVSRTGESLSNKPTDAEITAAINSR